MRMKRVFYGIFLILSAFFFPWWISVALVFFGALYFDNLYEAIAVGLIIDLTYGAGIEIYGFTLIFTFALTLMLYILSVVRKRILI